MNNKFTLKELQLIYRALLTQRDLATDASENNLLPTQLRLIAKLEEKQTAILLKKVEI